MQAAEPVVRNLEVASWASSTNFIEFTIDMYGHMLGDQERTAAFERAIQRRMSSLPSGAIVLDIGTGPCAILAVFAARAGATKVYAVEANAAAAELARATVAFVQDPSTPDHIAPGTIEVIEGFSTAITLPERADLLVSEIVGSIASEEGMYTSIRDARLRHMKRPEDPRSYIPVRCQTLAVPASYSPHHKLNCNWTASGPPVRLDCDDPWLRPLSAPQFLEDFAFGGAEPPLGPGTHGPLSPLVFTVDAATIDANCGALEELLLSTGVPAERATPLAETMAGSLSGVACWPRLVLDEGDGLEEKPILIESRGMLAEPRPSHWQTVLPLLCSRPAPIQAGEAVIVRPTIKLAKDVETAPRYEICASIEAQARVRVPGLEI